MTKNIYQIQVVLKNSKPKIWRRILVPTDISLSDLHKIIQISMGWTNSHLHQFIVGKLFFAPTESELEGSTDTQKIKLTTVLKKKNDKILYEYDFGDGWLHEIILEEIQLNDKNIKSPICIGGKQSCPPEDCGGIYGYINILNILSNHKHEEYAEMMDWLGDEFNPEYFNIDATNKLLQR